MTDSAATQQKPFKKIEEVPEQPQLELFHSSSETDLTSSEEDLLDGSEFSVNDESCVCVQGGFAGAELCSASVLCRLCALLCPWPAGSLLHTGLLQLCPLYSAS